MKYPRALTFQRLERRVHNFDANANTPPCSFSCTGLPCHSSLLGNYKVRPNFVILTMEELESIREAAPVIWSHTQDTASLLKDVCDSTLLSHVVVDPGSSQPIQNGKMYPSDFSEQVYLTSHFSQLLEKIEMQKEIPFRRERQANTMELTQYGSGKILFRLELVRARSLREAAVLIAQQYHKVDLGRRARCLGLLKRHFFLLSLSLRHCLSFTHTGEASNRIFSAHQN